MYLKQNSCVHMLQLSLSKASCNILQMTRHALDVAFDHNTNIIQNSHNTHVFYPEEKRDPKCRKYFL